MVHVQGAVHWIEALAAHRAIVDDSAIKELFEAMLDMIGERENLITNRAALTSLLGTFADRLSPELEQRVADVVSPVWIPLV